MNGQSTVVQNPLTRTKYQFIYDHSLWSFDNGNNFVDNDQLYDLVGKRALADALRGYNVTLFAYGQIGSGKTYTMFGPPGKRRPETGILPRLCRDIFRRIKIDKKRDTEWIVACTAVEIYNNKVNDLLSVSDSGSATPKAKPKPKRRASAPGSSSSSGLKIREHSIKGPYVEGLKTVICKSSKTLMNCIFKANDRRVTRSTSQNDHSSRSHCIIQVTMTRIMNISKPRDYRGERASLISIIDLAGSSRESDAHNMSDKTVSEKNAINLSLTSLGKVIDKLTLKFQTGSDKPSRTSSQDGSGSGRRSSGRRSSNTSTTSTSSYIPYRDNILTWLLKEALSGNSKTFLIATISPSSLCLEETLSTLRFADRVKKIRTYAQINEDRNPLIQIDELRQQIALLQFELGETEKARRAAMEELEKLRLIDSVSKEEFELQRQQYEQQMEELKHGYQEKIIILNTNMLKLSQSVELLKERKKRKDAEEKDRQFELEKLKKRMKSLQTLREERELEFDKLMKKKDELVAGKERMHFDDLERLKKEFLLKEGELGEKDEEMSVLRTEYEEELDELRSKMGRRDQSHERKRMEHLKELEDFEIRFGSLKGALQDMTGEKENLDDKIKVMSREIEEREEEVESFSQLAKRREKEYSELVKEKDEVESQKKKLYEEIKKMQVESESFRKDIEREIERKDEETEQLLEQEIEKTKRVMKQKEVVENEMENLKRIHEEKEKKQRENYEEENEKCRADMEQKSKRKEKEKEDEMNDLKIKFKKVWEKQKTEKEEAEKLYEDKIEGMENDFLSKKKQIMEKFNEKFERMGEVFRDNEEKMRLDSEKKIQELQRKISELMVLLEKRKLENENLQKTMKDKEVEMEKEFAEKLQKQMEEQQEEMNKKVEEMEKEKQKLRNEMEGKLKSAEIEKQNLMKEFELKLKELQSEFQLEKTNLDHGFKMKLEELRLEKDREIERMNVKMEFDKSQYKKRIQELEQDVKREKALREKLRQEKDLVIQKLKDQNKMLLDELMNWMRLQKMKLTQSETNFKNILVKFDDRQEQKDDNVSSSESEKNEVSTVENNEKVVEEKNITDE